MLIALTLLLLGGGGENPTPMPAQFDKHVKQVVLDEQRRKEILAANEAMGEILASYAKDARRLSKATYETNRMYGAMPADIEQHMTAFAERRSRLDAELIAKRMQVAKLLHEDEWDEVMRLCAEDAEKK